MVPFCLGYRGIVRDGRGKVVGCQGSEVLRNRELND